ncbi:sugar-binding domain-containing protein [Hymenobacter humi]|uniref:Sugar-binding domain-containing protein n=1 Tax=Hymenobacter humi TaxID=1411620 RepID=A0ABW2U987_9BACT
MNNFVLLDGQWRFDHDEADVGLRDDWALGHTYEHTAQWPGSVEEHLAQARGQQGIAKWQDQIVGWYEREFNLPEVAEPQSRSMLQLTFGACGYETRVWLNGQLLKTIEGETVHYGEYTSFTYELEEAQLHLVNRLTVRIADNMDAETTRGKQESHVYKRGGIWYQTYTGAVRSVWLEVVERNRLRSRVGVVSVVEDQLVRFNLTLRIHDAGQYIIRLRVFDPKTPNRETPLAQSDFPLHLEAGQWQQRVVLEVPGAERGRRKRRTGTGWWLNLSTPRATLRKSKPCLGCAKSKPEAATCTSTTTRLTSTAYCTSPGRPPTRKCSATCTP